MSQMIFTHDTELTLRAACVLINSDRVDGEQLGDLSALDTYLDGFGWTGQQYDTSSDLTYLRARYYSPGAARCSGAWSVAC